MKRFIFGFHRRVWCPKWTPASSSSFMVTTGAMVGCLLPHGCSSPGAYACEQATVGGVRVGVNRRDRVSGRLTTLAEAPGSRANPHGARQRRLTGRERRQRDRLAADEREVAGLVRPCRRPRWGGDAVGGDEEDVGRA